MEQRRSRSIADTEPRIRVMSVWAVLGVALAVSLTLALLFPRKTLLEQVQSDQTSDALTENYLANLLRTDPHNDEMRILLAQKRLALGNVGGAREVLTIATASQDPDIRRRALMLEYRIVSDNAEATLADEEARHPQQLAALRSRLSALATETWDPQDLVFLSGQARRWGMPALASRLAERIMTSPTPASVQQLTGAGDEALGAGDYVMAANLYFAARHRAASRDLQRELFLRGIAILQSGNLLPEALAAANAQIGDFADDEQILTRLAKLALAANQPAKAQDYVRRLLHMSANAASPAPALLARLLDWVIADAHAEDPPASTRTTLRPYDEEIYTLAYNVFLANGNVADAQRVAAAAVAQRPDDAVWRERLAQASEWSGHADAALAQWQAIAQRTGREDAWQAVLRLAPGVHDDAALLAAWQHEAARRRLTPAEWNNIAALYEGLGRPDDAIQYLEDRYREHADPAILETLAGLEERARRDDLAMASLQRLLQVKPDPALAVRLATLLLLHSEFERAYAVLQPLQSRAAAGDTPYWKLLADLAWQLQHDDTAANAYGVLNARGSALDSDMQRLVLLLKPTQPEEAGRIALLSWRRFHSVQGMMAALGLASDRHDYAGLGRLLQEIHPEDEAGLAAIPYYFTLRAIYFQGIHQPAAAMAEYRRALALTPRNTELRVAYLWLLIDSRDTPGATGELSARLAEWKGDAAKQSDYWDAYAAAWQTLGQPRLALPWLARNAARHGDDYVWLANYADALEASGEAGMAWRVRRHAWLLAELKVKRNPSLATGTEAGREAMLAYARLATASAPGDTALAAMRLLLRQDQPAAQAGSQTPALAHQLDAAATELVLSWNLAEERYDAAHAWMWTRYARRTTAPAWADYTLALAEHDWERLERLLQVNAPAVPPMSRIEAARATGQMGLAQTLGSEALERSPDDDDLHLRLATDLLATAASVIATDTAFARGVLAGHEQTTELQYWATPRLRIAVNLDFSFQHSSDTTQLNGVPGLDRSYSLSLLRRRGVEAADGETELTVGRREAVSDYNWATLRLARPVGDRLNATLTLSQHERAFDSVPLLVDGHKDQATLDLQYGVAAREYLNAQLWTARFHTQQDDYLGSGRGAYAEAGYRIRTDYPDVNIRVSRTISQYSAVDSADAASAALTVDGSIPPGSFFVPQSFRMWGLNLGLGTSARDQPTRGIRPYADIGRTDNSLSGSGYNWLLGAGGSVIGPDLASFYWSYSKGGSGTNVTVRELGLRYQYWFW